MLFYYSLGQRFAGSLGSSSRSCVARSCSYHDSDMMWREISGLAVPWCGVSTWCCDRHGVCSAEVLPAVCITRQAALLTGASTAQALESHPFGRLSVVFLSLQLQVWVAAPQPPQGKLNIWGLHKKCHCTLQQKKCCYFQSDSRSLKRPGCWHTKAKISDMHSLIMPLFTSLFLGNTLEELHFYSQ